MPRLFARNERVICDFDGAGGPFAVVLVGALFVGSMSTVWHGDVSARRPPPRDAAGAGRAGARTAARGAELGRFNMGSTVILLLGPDVGDWHLDAGAGHRAARR